MEYITFKQFIYTINIRKCPKSKDGGVLQDNTTIRIYYDTSDTDNYIEIGWYDYYSKDVSWELLKEMLSKKIIDSIVTDFVYDEDYGCF